MAKYRILFNSFAPWKKFALRDRYAGDNRGFNEKGTSRIHIEGVYDSQTKKFTIDKDKTGCDPSHGPVMIFGPDATKTGNIDFFPPKVHTNKDGSTSIYLHLQGSLPLIKGAPPIDYKGKFTIDEKDGRLEVSSSIFGSVFPAVETKIIDEKGVEVFLGGYSPDSRDKATRLIDSAARRILTGSGELGVVNTGRVSINRYSDGNFESIRNGFNFGVDKEDPLNPKGESHPLLKITKPISIENWNHRLIEATPLPSDIQKEMKLPKDDLKEKPEGPPKTELSPEKNIKGKKDSTEFARNVKQNEAGIADNFPQTQRAKEIAAFAQKGKDKDGTVEKQRESKKDLSNDNLNQNTKNENFPQSQRAKEIVAFAQKGKDKDGTVEKQRESKKDLPNDNLNQNTKNDNFPQSQRAKEIAAFAQKGKDKDGSVDRERESKRESENDNLKDNI